MIDYCIKYLSIYCNFFSTLWNYKDQNPIQQPKQPTESNNISNNKNIVQSISVFEEFLMYLQNEISEFRVFIKLLNQFLKSIQYVQTSQSAKIYGNFIIIIAYKNIHNCFVVIVVVINIHP